MTTQPESESGASHDHVILIERPPVSFGGILQRLGPGLIVAASIVGSGELIATTKTGAEAGFWLLWLILTGCVIKVFVQVEFGRFSIVSGQTTMDGLAQVPGPAIPGRGNWIVWYWFLMFLASMGQLGGIVGGVGQALAISVPLTESGREFNRYVDLRTELAVKQAELRRAEMLTGEPAGEAVVNRPALQQEIEQIQQRLERTDAALMDRYGAERFAKLGNKPAPPPDEYLWAGLITAVTSVALVLGRYGLVQTFATAMVALFTLVTVINLVMLQANPVWSVSAQDLIDGLSFRLPPPSTGSGSALATALATFGIIGVGASELVTYPYWCLEKGYARFTGPRDDSPAWGERARGWMRVMRWDAWCSMVIYTFATLAFYLLGAAILGRSGLNPEKSEMVRTLSVMYEPVFGSWAPPVFLFGAFAVLYSTFFVANASLARVFADVLRVLGFTTASQAAYRRRVRFFCGLLPIVCFVMYLAYRDPPQLVLISGLMQAIMLPMLAGAGLYFRYFRCDERLRPLWIWDVFLWISAVGMLIAGTWALIDKLRLTG